jgi:hypothetical protein
MNNYLCHLTRRSSSIGLFNDELNFIDKEIPSEQRREQETTLSSIEVEGKTAICVGKIEIPRSLNELDEGVGKKLRHML